MQDQFSLQLVTVYSRCSRQQSKGRDVERHRLGARQRCGGREHPRPASMPSRCPQLRVLTLEDEMGRGVCKEVAGGQTAEKTDPG